MINDFLVIYYNQVHIVNATCSVCLSLWDVSKIEDESMHIFPFMKEEIGG